MQPFVAGVAIVEVALVVDIQSLHQEGQGTTRRLLDIALAKLFADLQQLCCGGILAHQQASQMVAHASDEMLRLKALADNVVDNQQDIAGIALDYIVQDAKIIVIIEHV